MDVHNEEATIKSKSLQQTLLLVITVVRSGSLPRLVFHLTGQMNKSNFPAQALLTKDLNRH